jgi:hypothetical protein
MCVCRTLQLTNIGVEGGLIAAIEPGFVCDAPEHDAYGSSAEASSKPTSISTRRASSADARFALDACRGGSGVGKHILFDLSAFPSDGAWGRGCVSTSSPGREASRTDRRSATDKLWLSSATTTSFASALTTTTASTTRARVSRPRRAFQRLGFKRIMHEAGLAHEGLR